MIYRIFRIAYFFLKLLALIFHVFPEFLKAKFRRKENYIKDIFEGECAFNNGNYAIFLIFQKGEIAWYVKNALQSLVKKGVNVVLVSNISLNDDQIKFLKKLSFRIIIRENVGYDFGGYKDATLFLKKEKIEIDKVIYLNDSSYFYKKGLDSMVDNLLLSEYSAVTAYENWEYYYHMQSFCMSIDADIWNSSSFEEFWLKYLPVSSRLWAIKRGEVEFSKMTINLAKNIKVIYNTNALKDRLKYLDEKDLLSLFNFLPFRVRGVISKKTQESLVDKSLVDKILDGGVIYSQIHTLGFLHVKYNESPIIKKDLVYRVQFTPREFEDNLILAGCEENIEMVMVDIRRKGIGANLTGLKKIKWMVGIE